MKVEPTLPPPGPDVNGASNTMADWPDRAAEYFARIETITLVVAAEGQEDRLRIRLPVVFSEGVVLVRDLNGPDASWFQEALTTHLAHVVIDEDEHAVTARIADWSRSNDADAAFEAKYGLLIHGRRVASREARIATMQLFPAEETRLQPHDRHGETHSR